MVAWRLDRKAPPSFTWAGKPSAANYPVGYEILVTDIGPNGVTLRSDGTNWVSDAGMTVAQSGIATGIPSSGSIGNNGALTLTTALPLTLSQGSYMYFPANAIAAGVAAGLYYVVMGSTTTGTIYNNTYTSGRPSVPASPTAFATTGPGAYTQTTGSALTLRSHALPGGLLGAHGRVESYVLVEMPNNANAKTLVCKLGAAAYLTVAFTTSVAGRLRGIVQNMGSAAVQRLFASGSGASFVEQTTTGALTGGAENTATDLTLLTTGQLATATDYLFVDYLAHTAYQS